MPETAQERCRRYRRRILEISQQTTCHVSSAFSCLEIVDCLYHEVMREQDIFIMSKGHGYLSQLVVLEDQGKISREEMDLYCKPGGQLGAHPDYASDIGINASTGSLGHGLGIAAGQALGEHLKNIDARVYCLLSDGECQEGSTWEAAMVAANLRLDNLTVLVDANGWGGMGRIPEDFPAMENIERKFVAFGWSAYTVADGHDSDEVRMAANHVREMGFAEPSVLVCRTVKGNGVSFIEQGQPLWHYRSPSPEEYARALEEIG